MKKFIEKIKENKTILIFLALLAFLCFLHGYNSFHYPYFESDEGTYLSQAYSVKEDGKLSLYTYWYDHPPFGWFVIGAWTDVLGQQRNIFGSSLNTGRVMMLVLHIIQVSLLFYIVRRVTDSDWIPLIVCLLFAVSPLPTYFQRRVLLDNIMVTWLLASVAVFYIKNISLRHVILSGFFYGLATVTKVTAVMFGPAFLYLLLTLKPQIKRSFAVAGWLAVSISVVALWPIYALIKTEFFPVSDGSKVSLIGALQFQASRGTEVPFWDSASSFRDNLDAWMILDSTYVYILAFGLLCAVLLAIFSSKYRFFGLATLFYFIFLIRGGVVLGFYALPLIPFAMISIGGVVDKARISFKKRYPKFADKVLATLFILIMTVAGVHYTPKVQKYLTVDETSNQMEALIWVKENLPEDTLIMIDVYGMTELLDSSFVNEKSLRNADWYFKVAKDPAIRFDVYRDDWRNLDYILVSHEMLFQAEREELPLVKNAIRNSRPVIRWDRGSTAFVDVQNFISTNGDWAALYRVNDRFETQLLFSWNHYRDNFIYSYGQVIDPQRDVTTSEGQSYAMLRAALMNDREAFLGLWLWTQHKLQHRVQDELFSWSWFDGRQLDTNNATDADLDIALALIFASKMFDEPEYLNDAREIIADIWKQTVVEIRGRYYLLPMEKNSARRGNGYLLNPSYFSPAHYRLFAKIDDNPDRNWIKLADDSYFILERLSNRAGNISNLPPNWATVDMFDGSLGFAGQHISIDENVDDFGFDAFRVFWRVALDVEWYDSTAGRAYLQKQGSFFEREWDRLGGFRAVYDQSGSPKTTFDSQSVNSGILLTLQHLVLGEKLSEIYNELFIDNLFISDESEYAYWGNPEIYYDHNWSWLGLALFNGRFPNLWETATTR